MYIAVKDVKVPLVEKQISFAVCYSRGNTCAESMFVKCQIAYNGLEDLALLLSRKANNQIKDRTATKREEVLRVRYENERFHINVPIGFCLALSANICKLLGLHEELYNLCSSETKELVSEGELTKDDAVKNVTENVEFNEMILSSSVTCNFYSPCDSYCLFNFFDIIQS